MINVVRIKGLALKGGLYNLWRTSYSPVKAHPKHSIVDDKSSIFCRYWADQMTEYKWSVIIVDSSIIVDFFK